MHRYEDIVRFRRLKDGRVGLALTLKAGPSVELTSDDAAAGAEIFPTVHAKIQELAKQRATDTSGSLTGVSAEEEEELASKYLPQKQAADPKATAATDKAMELLVPAPSPRAFLGTFSPIFQTKTWFCSSAF